MLLPLTLLPRIARAIIECTLHVLITALYIYPIRLSQRVTVGERKFPRHSEETTPPKRWFNLVKGGRAIGYS